MKMVVVRNKDNSVSCLPILKSRMYYSNKYNVICFINKLWNPANILKVKKTLSKPFTN